MQAGHCGHGQGGHGGTCAQEKNEELLVQENDDLGEIPALDVVWSHGNSMIDSVTVR